MIGIFDSGVGGLTVVKEINQKIPEYDLVYFGDTARIPYGDKSVDIIKQYALEDAKFLVEKGAKIIIIACHTVSVLAFEYLKENIDVPLFGMVNPVIISAVESTKNKKIGILATQATIDSGIYEQRIQDYAQNRNIDIQVFSQAAPLLVPIIESGKSSELITRNIVNDYLKKFKEEQIDTLILACTHYPLLKDIIIDYLGSEVKIIDPSITMSEEISSFLNKQTSIEASLIKNNKKNIYFSKLSDEIMELSRIIIGEEDIIKHKL